jgi:hypothetical protein
MYIASKVAAGLIGVATLAGAAVTPIAFAKEKTDKVFVNISQNGHVEVHGAVVTHVSGDVVTATTEWGSTKLTWTVDSASSTKMQDKNGRKGGKGKNQPVRVADITVGNTINFNGTLDTTSSGLRVDARVIQNKSFKVAPKTSVKGIFQGIVETIASTTLPTTLGIQVGSTDYTVQVASTTKLLKNNLKAATFADIEVGDTVRVTGSANASNTVEAKSIRLLSI